jgi:hypothetical protein
VDPVTLTLGSGIFIGVGLAIASLRPARIVGSPRLVLAILTAISLGAVVSMVQIRPFGLRMELDPSSEPLLPVRDPGQEVYREAVLDFGTDDIYVIAMETGNVFTQENLEILRTATT